MSKKTPQAFLQSQRQMPDRVPVEARRDGDWHELYGRFGEPEAKTQASRCLDCGNPYCSWGCPLHNFIPQWLELAREGRVHDGTGRSLGYGELAEAAARLPVPADPALKPASELRLLGKDLRRLDTPLKVAGKARFGLDVRLPGMLVAVVARSPEIGGKLGEWDAAAAKAIPGVRHVVAVDAGLAVVADHFHAARQGREALKIQWLPGPGAQLSSAKIRADMLAALDAPSAAVARNDGDVASAAGAQSLAANYELPYLAHACMEPMNATASVTADGIEIWAPTQAPGVNRAVVAAASGIPPERVRVHTTMLGGGFGRRFAPDFVATAVQLSKAVGASVKLVYTREDDMRAQYYRPAVVARLAAGLDAAGLPVRYQARLACASVGAAGGFPLKGDVDENAVEGLDNWPYAVANARVEWVRHEAGVGVWFWRSVGSSHNGFIAESFIDELAHAAGRDPYEYRRALLADKPRPRFQQCFRRGVLQQIVMCPRQAQQLIAAPGMSLPGDF